MKEALKKLKFKNDTVMINAPSELAEKFAAPGFKTALDKKQKSTGTLVFINNNKAYPGFLNRKLKHVEPDNMPWFFYPEGTSKIKTDINRDDPRTGETFHITTVTAVSINDTWSACVSGQYIRQEIRK